jgi:hypothetical protein
MSEETDEFNALLSGFKDAVPTQPLVADETLGVVPGNFKIKLSKPSLLTRNDRRIFAGVSAFGVALGMIAIVTLDKTTRASAYIALAVEMLGALAAMVIIVMGYGNVDIEGAVTPEPPAKDDSGDGGDRGDDD